MKTNTLRRVIYGLALLTGLSACEEEQLENQILTEAEMEATIEAPISASVAFEGASADETRTYIDEHENYASGVGTLWRPKEVIGVYGTGMTNAKFTGTNTKNAGSVSFSGSLLGSPKYAYYPYSADNKGVKQTAVKGNMPNAQDFNQTTKDIVGDYRAGIIDSRGWFSSTFTFKRLVSILKFTVDATGSALEGDRIKTIAFKVDNNRQLAGNFTINLTTQEIDLGAFEEGDDSLTLTWTDEPTLSSGAVYKGYMTTLPSVQKGDAMHVTITTDKHIATFTRASKVNYVANSVYNLPCTLKDFTDMVVTEIEQEEVEVPAKPLYASALKSMKFTVEDNPGKILPGTVKQGTTYTANIKEAVCTIDTAEKKIKLYLPYLNNRKLVPTFEVEEGISMVNEAGEIISSETEVDFATYKQVALTNEDGAVVVYDVELTNTGLPVVVINQETGVTSTESNSEYSKASAAWYKLTGTKWIPKDGDWQMTEGVDNFMVYNADGTSAISDKKNVKVDAPILSSTRLRGNVTQQMPKKSFAVKLDKKTGIFMNDSDPNNDLPAHKRWVLLANWKDRTMMRNALAFSLADAFKRAFPNDGMAWNPSGQHVELVYNGVHVGTYYLCEQIKIDENRLAINEPFDEKDNPWTGDPSIYGYLMESDDGYDENWQFTTANYIPFLFKDDAEVAGSSSQMLQYAQNFVRGIEDNLFKNTTAGYTAAFANMDLTSMVDFWLIQEMMMNSETKHPKSCYWYLNNGKLYAGPVWDFDWNTLPTSSSNSEESYSFTASMLSKASPVHKRSGYPTSPSTSDKTYLWYPMLVKNATFKNLAAERWNGVQAELAKVPAEINAIASKITLSESVNSTMWKVEVASSSWSKNAYGMGGGKCGDESMSFSDAVSTLLKTLNTRINGMSFVSNKNWPSKSFTTK